MQKFVILTRGRTGSSAIAEELGHHPQIVCHGELARGGVKPDGRYKTAPLRVHAKAFGRKITPDEFAAWFDYLAQSAGDAKAVGFKVLDHQLGDIEGGYSNLQDFKIVHLQRYNLIRQALSAILARERQLYNSKKPQAKWDPIPIEPMSLSTRVRRAQNSLQQIADTLRYHGILAINAFYEDWVNSPPAFYQPIFEFLDVTNVTLPPTTWQPMAPHPIDQLITNYDRVARRVRRAGFGDMLV